MKNGTTKIKSTDIQGKIDTHKETLTKLREETEQLRQALMEREQQIIAVSGAIEGLSEFIPQEEIQEQVSADK